MNTNVKYFVTMGRLVNRRELVTFEGGITMFSERRLAIHAVDDAIRSGELPNVDDDYEIADITNADKLAEDDIAVYMAQRDKQFADCQKCDCEQCQINDAFFRSVNRG